jgi:putative transposase
MASESPTWGQAQIAAELELKIGIRLSPRTVAKYMPKSRGRPGSGVGSQSWRTFLQNHAKQIVACDFFTVVAALLKVFYMLIVMEHASRRIIHFNVTDHPTAAWTTQQFKEALPSNHEYRSLVKGNSRHVLLILATQPPVTNQLVIQLVRISGPYG